jgi:hypothetical protein
MELQVRQAISLKQARLDKLVAQHLWGPEETVIYASEVTKLHLHGGKDSRVLLISIGGIYVFSGKGLQQNFNVVDLERISYIFPDILTMVFKEKQLTCQVNDALTVVQGILWLHKVVFFRQEVYQSAVKVEATPEKAIVYPDFSARQKNSLQVRMCVLAHHYGVRIPPESPRAIAEWDARPQAVMKLPNQFICGDATRAIAHAIAWESEVKSLVMDAVALPTLHIFLQTLFAMSPFLTRISLDDYVQSPGGEFDFSGSAKSKLTELSFRNCHTNLAFLILNALAKFEGRITTLTVSKCKFLHDHFAVLYRLIGSLPAFMSLSSLRLEDGTGDGLELRQFAEFLSVPRIKYLSVGKSEVDVAAILSAVGPRLVSVRSLLLNNGHLYEKVTRDLTFGSSIIYFDLSRTAVYPSSLQLFLTEVVNKPRRGLLTLVLSDLITSSASDEMMAAFDVKDAQPVIAEFNYSGNEVTSRDLPKLVEFLKTQKHLQFLALSRCFRERAEQAVEILGDFIIESRLQGLELSSDPACPLEGALVTLLTKLTGQCVMYTLICERSMSGDAGLDALRQFVDANPKLTSLACDGTKPASQQALVRAYEAFARVERLAPPRMDFSIFPQLTIPDVIANKHPPKMSGLSRSSDYESLDGHADAAVQPMNALIGIMSLMVSAIKNPDVEGNIFMQQDMVEVFKNSMITTNVALKAGERTQDPLLDMMNPQSQTAEEFMTEYQTMHIF